MWHLEGHSTFLLLLPPAAGLGYDYFYYFYPCWCRHYQETPCRHQNLTVQIICVRKFCPKPLLPGEMYALNQRTTGGTRQNCWPGGPGQLLSPGSVSWLKALISFGLLIITMVSATHSSWVAHRRWKHRETDPECPEEKPQSTPLVSPNNCAFADLSRAPQIQGQVFDTKGCQGELLLAFVFPWMQNPT